MQELLPRVMDCIEKREDTGCWIWTGRLNHGGYGQLTIKQQGKIKSYRVHRLMYELHTGQKVGGKFVCRTCDASACCNPDHLYLDAQPKKAGPRSGRTVIGQPELRGDGCYLVPMTCGRKAIVDAGDYPLVAQIRWSFSEGYAKGQPPERKRSLGMHRVIMGDEPGTVIDHINGDALDNRRSNLRRATFKQNRWNSRGSVGTSRFKGVNRPSRSRKWRASIYRNGKSINLGLHETEEEAARAYDRAARELDGEFARTNEDLGHYAPTE